MSKVPTEFELFKLLPPEKREQVLAKLLPGLGDMLGAVYDDYKVLRLRRRKSRENVNE
jgi:hypothetical protein